MITKTCLQCGKEFPVYPSQVKRGRKCCCKKCSYKWQSQNMAGENSPHWKGGKREVHCAFCGKPIYRRPSSLKGRINYFCNSQCKGNWQRIHGPRGTNHPLSKYMKGRTGESSHSWKGGGVERVCRLCGVKFEAPVAWVKKGGREFCGEECYRLYNRGKTSYAWKGGPVTIVCLQCGNKFPVSHGEISRGGGKFCSPQCFGKYHETKVKRVCLICKTEFKVKHSRVKRGHGNFCSRRCAAIWHVGHMPSYNTSIELAIESEFKKREISYRKQVPVEGIALVDFLLPGKIIVECDGDYWHSLEKNKKRDVNKDFQLFFKGYKTFRFTETEIKKSAKRCVNKLLKEVGDLVNA